MHDRHDEIIYVGKAVSLKNRVRQYFQESRSKTAKIEKMVSRIARFEYIITDSELEALVLECNLIKEHRPRYNTMLKDDKTYPYIKVTMDEAFPRVLFSRTMKKDKCRYFGPYTSAGAVKDTIDLIQKLWKLRTCARRLPQDIGKERPCLNYHIKQCQAPCQGYISQEEYGKAVAQTLDFLNGKYEPVLSMLEEKMMQASDGMDFEKAIEYRELLNSVKQVAQKQKITSQSMEDRDIIAMARDSEDAVVQVFFVRDGKLIGREHFHISASTAGDDSQIIGSFVKQFYAGTPFIPREVWVQQEFEEMELVSQWLTKRRGQNVKFVIPKKGQKERLVELAAKNALLVLSQDKEKIKREELKTIGAMNQVGEWLGLSGVKRIEAFDISNISGFESVGSMVVYEDGRPSPDQYRAYAMPDGGDDYGTLYDWVARRLESGPPWPDLMLIDGGRGQLAVVERALNDAGKPDFFPLAAIAKARDEAGHADRRAGNVADRIFLPGRSNPLPLREGCAELLFLQNVRDATHRFAIGRHRKARGQAALSGELMRLPGIGPATARLLWETFGSLEAMRAAGVDDLRRLPGIGASRAALLHEKLKGLES